MSIDVLAVMDGDRRLIEAAKALRESHMSAEYRKSLEDHLQRHDQARAAIANLLRAAIAAATGEGV